MAIPMSDRELLECYRIDQELIKEGMGLKRFCAKYGYDYVRQCNFRYRYYFKSENDPEFYKILLEKVNHFLQLRKEKGGMAIVDFIRQHYPGGKPSNISDMLTHLKYQERIKKMMEKPMQFIAVQPKKQEVKRIEEPEVLAPQNEIELKVSQGVRVMISPNLDSMKIIKIIELLKDL